jgi:ACS family hexuronate transporter-like MFS transporter
MRSAFSLRWVAVSVFVLSSTISYLDKFLLSALAPLIMDDFHLNKAGFGFLASAFAIAYAAASLFMGWFLDRVGVNRGISAAVAWWSVAAVGTGLTQGLGALAFCRAALGIGESASVSAVGKLNGMYLKPEERALGAAVNGVGLSLGSSLAPLWVYVAYTHTWRTPFIITGLFGFVWIPIWLAVSRTIPPHHREQTRVSRNKQTVSFALLRDSRVLLLMLVNVLWMGGFSLWTTWTTIYLTDVHHLSLKETPKYLWIPPLVSNLGGFFGGWLSLKWIKRQLEPVAARRRAVWVSALGGLLTLLLPFAPDAAWATFFISVSFFFILAGSVNIYAIPIDLFGPERSGLAISTLVFAYGLFQTVSSPIIGYLADHHLYTVVVWSVAIPPILGALLLSRVRDDSMGR